MNERKRCRFPENAVWGAHNGPHFVVCDLVGLALRTAFSSHLNISMADADRRCQNNIRCVKIKHKMPMSLRCERSNPLENKNPTRHIQEPTEIVYGLIEIYDI